MSYDIYGEHLRPGFCEVHPYVESSYPCPICITENIKHNRDREEYQNWMNEEYYRFMAGQEYDAIEEGSLFGLGAA